MELRNVKTFLAVAELGSFSRAAEKLGYSQSNISFQIRQLEEELGVALFERGGRSITITAPGRDFLFYANEMAALSRQAAAAVSCRNSFEQIAGSLRIGSVESLATSLLPELLADFRLSYPGVRLSVQTGSSRAGLAERVRNNELDLFFDLNEKSVLPDMKRELLRREEIVFIAPAAAPEQPTSGRPQSTPAGRSQNGSAGERPKQKIPLAALAKEDFVLTESGEGYRPILDGLFAACDLAVVPVMEFGNPQTIIDLVARGAGLSFLPLFCAEEAVRSGRIAVLRPDAPRIYTYSQLFYHKNKWLSPQLEALLAFVRRRFSEQT